MQKRLDLSTLAGEGPVQQLLDELALLGEQVGSDAFYPEVLDFLYRRVSVEDEQFKRVELYEFTRGLQPRLLGIRGGGHDPELIQYLKGLYLLDPVFDLFENRDKTGRN